MQKILDKAEEGGYDLEWAKPPFKECRDYCAIVLDPLFWQALGKACGWVEIDFNGIPVSKGWKYHALRFYEINLTEGWDKAVKWLEDLVTPPTE